MRFFADGPDIPDELLIARDEGRVVFFCGAGVSLARAGLPHFYGLADKVLAALEGKVVDSPSRRLIDAARRVERESQVGGLVAADRVFSILQRDFEVEDVEAAVAKELKPAETADLSAHRMLLELARGPDGRTRLVTTNFELLFEQSAPALKRWDPRLLPDPERYEEFDGIVHLHGVVLPDYSGAVRDGFVLSSAEFGRAYISNGWATRFISSVLKKYLVVFVGYSADDPPVQYLLEALNRQPGSSNGLFAFQSGSHSDAQARWQHKGVVPIPYDDLDHHHALWNSLEAWAARARDVEAWYDAVIANARKGPIALQPHERAQIKHVVSTHEGARRFISSDDPPPAEWLCVFDRTTRFGPPRRDYSSGDEMTRVDPFSLYGLDSDPVPPRAPPDEAVIEKRDVPADAWDCFALTRQDRENVAPGYLASLSGAASASVTPLVPRLAAIGVWLSGVSEQPSAVWWAARRRGLHTWVQSLIRHHLDRDKTKSSPEVRRAWRLLFEAWETPPDFARRDWYELLASIKVDGWSSTVVRQFAALHAPHLSSTESIFFGPRPPAVVDGPRSLVFVQVSYPHLDASMHVPDDHVLETVRLWRALLERALLLENDVNPSAIRYHLTALSPEALAPGARRPDGLSAFLLFYRDIFRRLIDLDAPRAREELASWWRDDNTVFTRLRIWSSGEERLFSAEEAAQLIGGLNQGAFWNHGHQADLLHVLAKRWKSFSAESRQQLADRLRAGPDQVEGEESDAFGRRRVSVVLNRIKWLHGRGCELGFNVEEETATLQVQLPGWKPSDAAEAGEDAGPRVRSVRTDARFDALLNIPLAAVAARARALSGEREWRGDEKDPFAGLAADRPVRAISAARLAMNDALQAWTTLLNVQARKNREKQDAPFTAQGQLRYSKLLVARLASLPSELLVQLLNAVADWLQNTSERYSEDIESFQSIMPRLIAAVGEVSKAEANKAPRKERDWASEAINRPAGKLAQALMADPSKSDAEPGGGFDPAWLALVEQLVSAPGDARRHALAIFSYNLNWFYIRDPEWAQTHLLSALATEEDRAALWAGVLWSGQHATTQLYQCLKPSMLKLSDEGWVRRQSHLEVLSAMLLNGWFRSDDNGTPLITDDEMRGQLLNGGDDFRAQVIWHFEHGPHDGDLLPKIRRFFTDVWPRQKVIKTPLVSARLAEFVFADAAVFDALSDVIVGRVATVERVHLMLHDFIEKPDPIVTAHPEKVLALLARLLPADVSQWPYRIEEIIDRLLVVRTELRTDGRMLELRRRWNTR